MSCVGGLAPAASAALKRLAALIAEKEDKQYGAVITWLRVKLSFALVRAAVTCLRGTRSTSHRPRTDWSAVELHVAESHAEADSVA